EFRRRMTANTSAGRSRRAKSGFGGSDGRPKTASGGSAPLAASVTAYPERFRQCCKARRVLLSSSAPRIVLSVTTSPTGVNAVVGLEPTARKPSGYGVDCSETSRGKVMRHRLGRDLRRQRR